MNSTQQPKKLSIKSIFYLYLVSIAFGVLPPVQAQIIPDSTLGTEASQLNQNQIIKDAPGDKIDGGATRGINLFHSFSEFNIQEGQRVYFANPTGIENILTRVTGRNGSNIFGTLGVDGNANLFLMNPNGILFGKNASLDVQGSFVGTTANGLKFGNQGVFSATNPIAPGLLTINPNALTFSQQQSGVITNQSQAPAGRDPAGFDAFGLRVPDGKSLLLVGGNVNIDGGGLNAFGGNVELGGLAEPGDINLFVAGDNLRLGFPKNGTRADVSLNNQTRVDVTGVGGGNLVINAGNIDILNGSILDAGISAGRGTPETIAGDMRLNATGGITVADGSLIRNLVLQNSQGKGGNITIDTGFFQLRDGAQLNPSTSGQGNAGSVKITATDAVSLTGNAYIFSIVEAGGVGKGGNIDIDAASLSLTDGASLVAITRGASGNQPPGKGDAGNVNVKVSGVVNIAGFKNGFLSAIFSSVQPDAEGNGGNITIGAGSFQLRDGAQLIASTYGQGNAGSVKITATDAVSLTDARIFSSVEAGGVGKGGNIDINAASLSLTDVASLVAITRGASRNQPPGKGDGGNVNVKVSGVVDIAGKKGIFSSGIFSRVDTGAEGNGGNITIDAASLSLTDGAVLDASTLGQGNAGNVKITATDAVSLTDARIFSIVSGGGVGKGGNIDINAASLSLTDGAQLQTITRRASANQPPGKGDAGNVNVKVSGVVDIAGVNVKDGFPSGIGSSVQTGTEGNGGNITINANSFKVRDSALLDARTQNNNRGGDITVTANVVEALNGGQLTTTTSSNGSAGKITVNAKDRVTINANDPNYNDRLANFPNRIGNIGANSGFFVSSTGAGATGDIEVNSPRITLDNQGKLNAESASGNGGNINLNSDVLLLRRGSQISTTAGNSKSGGDGGNINFDGKFIVAIPNENSDISANAFTGKGGNIQINAQGIFGIESRPKPTDKSDITASSEQGISGLINLNQPDNSSLQNSFTQLSPNAIDTNALIANSCIARSNKRQENSFTVTGSGALRNSPGDLLISTYTTGDVRGVESTSRPWKKGDPIIEPQGLYKLPNGQLLLSRACN